jgi:hypothetical protein
MRRRLFAVFLLVACARRSDGGEAPGTTTDPTISTSSEASSDPDTTTTGDEAGASSSESTGSDACLDPAPEMTSTVVLPTPTGEIHGTWFAPAGCGPFPTVLFHVGSGPTDRDGNSVGFAGSNDGHLQLAEALRAAGIASVRFDKRGVAGSEGALENWEDIVVESYVDDLRLWIELLRQQQDTVGEISVLGHSEGSVIGTLAATQIAVDHLVLVAGPGRALADVLRTQLEQNLDDPELLAQANAIIAELEMGNTVEDVPTELLSLFDPSVQPFLISLFAVDPAAELAKITAPTTIIAGTADIQVPVSEGEALLAAKPDANLRIIENMTHVFKDAGMGQDAAYTDPDVPLADGLVDAVLEAVLGDP